MRGSGAKRSYDARFRSDALGQVAREFEANSVGEQHQLAAPDVSAAHQAEFAGLKLEDGAGVKRDIGLDQCSVTTHVQHLHVPGLSLAAMVPPANLEPAGGPETLVESILRAGGVMS